MSGKYLDYITIDNYHEDKTVKFLCFQNCIISVELFLNKTWEPHMHRIFEKYITKDSIVIEGGAYIGTHTIKLAYLSKHVYAFEPMPQTNNTLTNNLKLNDITNVTVFNEGLSDKIGNTYYEWSEIDNPGGSGLANNPDGKTGDTNPYFINILENKKNKIEVNLITIDSLNLQRVDFIKLDIEGYEILAINGAIETIKKYKPIITLEVWSSVDKCDIEYTKSKFKILLDLGYTVEQISVSTNIEYPDFLFLPIPI